MPLLSDKRLEELELRVARLEKWLDALKQHTERKPSSASEAPSEIALATRVERIEQALVSNFNVDVTR
jgi:uncharacterized coiled-coil protein SlyX